MTVTKQQIDTLERIATAVDTYRGECEKAQQTDTGELWSYLSMYAGAVQSILDSTKPDPYREELARLRAAVLTDSEVPRGSKAYNAAASKTATL